MNKINYLMPALALFGCGQKNEQRPNVIIIMADDLGFGDVSAYGSTTISTPNIDRLANGGICFDNGYATSATSTPSRYAMLTGMYPWKNKDARILDGDAPLLIDVEQFTLPKMMKAEGYATAAIGKWHLGMGNGNINWNEPIKPGAREVGFDYSCLIAATNDRVPTVYVEDGEVVGLDKEDPILVNYEKNFEGEPTALTNPELLRMQWSQRHNNSIVNGIPRIGYMKGGQKARWVDEDMADYFLGKVKGFIRENKNEPFFLFYGLHEPHVPRAPHGRFAGATSMGPRGDAIIEADWCVGELIAFLEKENLLDNTLIIFTSDNGPVLDDGYHDGAVEMAGHHSPTGPLRGGKYSLFDGGTHVPLFIFWKGRINPGVSNALVSHLDFTASLGKLIGAEVPDNLDSQNTLSALIGKSQQGRTEIIVEAQGKLGLRTEKWTMLPPYNGPERNLTGNEVGNLGEFGLFDMTEDIGQRSNLAKEYPDTLNTLKTKFFALTDGYYKANVGLKDK